MKLQAALLLTLFATTAVFADELPCDVRMGHSAGVRVIEFASGNSIHSKMSIKDASGDAILQEMKNLQDMGICTEKINAQRCVLKYTKVKRANLITLHRGSDKWMTWMLQSKNAAQNFVKDLKRVGFCS